MFFVGIWKDKETDFELISIHTKNIVSEREAEKIVDELNTNLGLKQDGLGGYITTPENRLCAMYDHMDEI